MDSTTSTDRVLYARNGRAAVATINYPEHLNALSYEVRGGLRAAYSAADEDPAVRVLIITGVGRAFCAGNDISLLNFDITQARADIEDTVGLFHVPELTHKPAIAAVNGYALGGGFELALGCDLIVASEEARFGTPEARIGAAAGFAMMRLPQLVGKQRAMELLMTTDYISAHQAYEWGIVNRVVPKDQLLSTALELAERIAAQAPAAMQLYKRTVNRHCGGEDLIFAVEACDYLFATEDQKEGRNAFLEKRRAVFKGR